MNRNNESTSSSGYQSKCAYFNNNNNNNLTNSTGISNGQNIKSNNRYPIELFSKKEMNSQQAKLLNNYRIQSAQNLAKQRSTGK
jgi:hypothetical protein